MSITTCEQRQLTSFCCVSIERDAHTTFIRIEGELDLSCEDGFRAEIANITAWQPGTVVVDLCGLTFIDLSGLRVLLELEAASRRNDFDLTLVHADRRVQTVMTITGLGLMLPLYDRFADGRSRQHDDVGIGY